MKLKLKIIFNWTGLIAAASIASGVMVAMAAYLYLAPLLPAAETYRDVQLETPLRIYLSLIHI